MAGPSSFARSALRFLVSFCILLAFPAAALQRPTPAGAGIEEMSSLGLRAWYMRVPFDAGLPDPVPIGFVLTCAAGGNLHVALTFGPYPSSGAVQLAVRSPDGSIQRFGDPLPAPSSGASHDPSLEAPADQRRFLRAALQTGALLSNGYRSFWNRVPPDRNARVRADALACLDGGPDYVPR